MIDGAILTGESFLFALGLFAAWDITLGRGPAFRRLVVAGALSLGLAWARAEMFPLAGLGLLADPAILEWEWPAYAAWSLLLLAWGLGGASFSTARRMAILLVSASALWGGAAIDAGASDRFSYPAGTAAIDPSDPILDHVAHTDILALLETARAGGGLMWVRVPGQAEEVLSYARPESDGAIELEVGLGHQAWTPALAWSFYAALAASCLMRQTRPRTAAGRPDREDGA